MTQLPLHYFLALAALLFATGAVGFLIRRNLLVMLMSIELMLNGVNLTLVAFNRIRPANHAGHIFTFFIIAIAAAEAAVGLALVLAFFRLRGSVRADEATLLKH
ncbi:MAG: NADH-quinone oxidoreductase subunit NuoK [Myxococcales bacterium]|nr:NADH-quinone oxidoreductase subunit NuoK [Myxococcales bacterium]